MQILGNYKTTCKTLNSDIFQFMYYLQAFIDQRTLFFVHKVAATATFAKTRILLFLGSCAAAEQDVT